MIIRIKDYPSRKVILCLGIDQFIPTSKFKYLAYWARDNSKSARAADPLVVPTISIEGSLEI